MIRLRIALAICGVAAPLLAFTCQAETPSSPPSLQNPQAAASSAPVTSHTVSDSTRYYFFFQHVVNLQKSGEKMDAAGKNGDVWKSYFKRKIDLSDEQAQTLTDVAQDCVATYQAKSTQWDSEREQWKSAHPGESWLSHVKSSGDALGKQHNADRDAMVLAHVQDLKDKVGPEAFRLIDDYMRNVDVKVGSVKSSGLPSAQRKADDNSNAATKPSGRTN